MKTLLAIALFTTACATSPADTSEVDQDLCNGSCQCVPISGCTPTDVENGVCCPTYHHYPTSTNTVYAINCGTMQDDTPYCIYTDDYFTGTIFAVHCSLRTLWLLSGDGNRFQYFEPATCVMM